MEGRIETAPLLEGHTKTVPSTSPGEISFHGYGKATHTRVPYLRVDTEVAETEDVLDSLWQHLMMKNISSPKMVVSVTGCTDSFIETRLKNSIKRGLVNVATMSGAWIITEDTETGVMQFVGEAVRDHQPTTGGTDAQEAVILGIATCGTLTQREDGLPVRYSINDAKDLQYKEHTAPLDANHTLFLLVDDRIDGNKKRFRAALESYISSQPIETCDSQAVPVVQLVLGGDVNTLETVYQALERHIPVVIIQGSGRAADFISLAYKDVHGWDEASKLTLDEQVQRTRAATMFEWSEGETAEGVEKAVATLKKILSPQNKPMLTVFHMDDVDTTNEVDEALLFALLKERQPNAEQQLNLALVWNRCDVARIQIFDTKNKSNWQTLDLKGFMRDALLHDRVDFVELFMDNEVNLKKFVTKKTLRVLYSKMQEEGKLLCFQHTRPVPRIMYTIGKYINSVLGGHVKSLYNEDDEKENDDDKELDIPERHLFFWALLVNRQHLANLFWRAGRDHIGGALVASSMLQSLGKMANIAELEQELFKSAKDWEKVAEGVLTECYQGDKERSHDLLSREIPTWGNSTLFVMAYSGEHMDFMGHTCCQTKLNSIWRGKMDHHTPRWKIILCMFMPVFLNLIRFAELKPKSTKKKPVYQKKKLAEESMMKKRTEASINSSRQVPLREKDVQPPQCDWSSTADLGWVKKDQNTKVPKNTDTPGSRTLLSALINFHKAPITKFGYHILSSVVLTGLFSYFVLTDLAPLTKNRKPSYVEYVVWGWAATLVLEELRQVAVEDPISLISKIRCYLQSAWNQLDLVMHLTLGVSIVLRYSLHGDSFVWARLLYSIVVVMYYLRLMNFFFADKKVGPKVIMIRHMLKDISFFMVILLTVMLAYGVAIQSLLFPNSPPTFQLLRDVLYRPYWHIYGELFLDQLEGDVDNCSDDERVWGNATYGVARCPQKNGMVILTLVVYMIITNILLVNLLIAMFSYTFIRVQENSEKVWCYYFYSLVYEYLHKPILVPPFIIIAHLYRLLSHGLNTFRCCKYRKCCAHKKKKDLKKRLTDEENLDLTMFEREAMENYLLEQRIRESEDTMSKAFHSHKCLHRDYKEEEMLVALQHHMTALIERQMRSQTQSMEKTTSAPHELPTRSPRVPIDQMTTSTTAYMSPHSDQVCHLVQSPSTEAGVAIPAIVETNHTS